MSLDEGLILREVLKESAENTALMVIDIPKNAFPIARFEDLPEYQRAVNAVKDYFEAVGRRYDEVSGKRK